MIYVLYPKRFYCQRSITLGFSIISIFQLLYSSYIVLRKYKYIYTYMYSLAQSQYVIKIDIEIYIYIKINTGPIFLAGHIMETLLLHL